MEKQNFVSKRTTPCKAGSSRFCECPDCFAAARNKLDDKQAAVHTVDIRDTDKLARMHK